MSETRAVGRSKAMPVAPTDIPAAGAVDQSAASCLEELIASYDATETLAKEFAVYLTSGSVWDRAPFPRERELAAAKRRFDDALAAARRTVSKK